MGWKEVGCIAGPSFGGERGKRRRLTGRRDEGRQETKSNKQGPRSTSERARISQLTRQNNSLVLRVGELEKREKKF